MNQKKFLEHLVMLPMNADREDVKVVVKVGDKEIPVTDVSYDGYTVYIRTDGPERNINWGKKPEVREGWEADG